MLNKQKELDIQFEKEFAQYILQVYPNLNGLWKSLRDYLHSRDQQIIQEFWEKIKGEKLRFDDEDNKPPKYLEYKEIGWCRYEEGYNVHFNEQEEVANKLIKEMEGKI